ncbi:MAG: ATP-dependent helicase [Dehalococcoidia bacterium]
MTDEYLSQLNPPQREAVETIEGPLLIVAGPGSGKTRVITNRIAYLIQTCGVSPYKIAALTFTNKAAKEMQERLRQSLGQSALRISASTFHSFCSMILRQTGDKIGLANDFVIFDDDDQIAVVKRAMTECDIDPKRFSPRSILSTISGSKSQLIDVNGYRTRKSNYYEEIVSRVYEKYEEILAQSIAVDFDDLLMKTHSLFELKSILKKYQDKYLYLMVDEFQDTNIAQYNIAKQLTESHKNLCVVGDPDQSIYSWRNADIRNILSFQTDYPNAKVISLEENYRSTQTILRGAKSVISTNKSRVDKDLWTNNTEGTPIIVMEGYNEEEEAQLVIREIGRISESGGYSLGNISVMYRVNAQSRAFEMACQRYGVPYQVVGGVKFYQRREIKDITAYLRLILNTHDDISLNRIINVPTRGIGQRTIDELTRTAHHMEISLFEAIDKITSKSSQEMDIPVQLGSRAIRALSDFKDLINLMSTELDTSKLVSLIESVLTKSGLKRHVQSEEQAEDRIENIQEYISSAAQFSELQGRQALTSFLESISLVADIDSLEDGTDFLTLITLHQAKGLEFPVVFVAGMEEGILPHIRSIESGDPSELEEERRLFYVGMTRAGEKLYLMRSFRRGFRGGSGPSAPSRFLSEIPDELITIPGKEQTSPKPQEKSPIKNAGNQPRHIHATSKTPRKESFSNSKKAKPRIRRIVNKISPPNSDPVYKTGDKVKHHSFGDGIVLNTESTANDVQVTVAFKEGTGVKKLLASFAKLEKTDQ